MSVIISVQDAQWKTLWTFLAEDNKVFTTMAKEHNVDIPIACGSWACGVCMCKIVQGKDLIERNKIGEHLIPVDEDHILTCVSWVKTQYLTDANEHTIILQRKL